MENRKHSRSSEGEINESSSKRLKLDSLFNKLTINDCKLKVVSPIEPTQVNVTEDIKDIDSESEINDENNILINESRFIINPKLKSQMIFKKSPSPKGHIRNTDINSYLSNKIISHFNSIAHSNLKIIKAYNPKLLLIYRFQKWVIKLFNRFLIKYNRHNNHKIPRIKYYDKIISLIQQNNIPFQQLIEIINQENNLALIQLKQRQEQSKVNSMREFDLSVYNGISYKYWDTLKFDDDHEMSDSSSSKVEEIPIDIDDYEDDYQDIEMETDESKIGVFSESNYGSYYDYDSNELMTV